MSKFKSGDYVVPSSQIVTYDVKMKNYLGRVLQVTTVHEKEYYGSVQAGIPGEEALGWNPHDLRFATAEEIEETTKPKSLMNTNHWLVGHRVLNVHRQSCDLSQEIRNAYIGTVIGVDEGCNAVIWVQFDGCEFLSAMCQQDLAYCDLWPGYGSRVDVST